MSSNADSPTVNSEDEIGKWSLNSPSSTASKTDVKVSNLLLHSQVADKHETAATSTVARKSAFQPYRPIGKVLTNLQRGNTEAPFCPAEVALSFHERAGQGELTQQQISAEYARANGDLRDEHGFTPLHWAAYYGQVYVVQLLLDVAHVEVDTQAPEMVTPLLLAACSGHNEVVRLLLERGANAAHMDIMGNTALMYAAAGNHPHTCHDLLSTNVDITVTNENDDTAYSLAVENGSSLAQAVIEHFLLNILLPL